MDKEQQNESKQATVFDVARLAKVSRGTVDRVVYNRGRVSPKTQQRVRDAISTLGYIPNPNAASLASKREYLFACLIPEFGRDEYWAKIHEGFIEGAKSMYNYNIRLEFCLYDQTDPESFRAACSRVIAMKPSGVILNAVFKEDVTMFAGQLKSLDIPFAFVDNKVDELDYTLYYGVDPARSGALGAFLLTSRCDVKDIALIRLIRDSSHKADPNASRRRGFLDYISETFPQCNVHTLFIRPENPKETYSTLSGFFLAHPEIKHIAMTNSRVCLIDDYLDRNPDPERIVVGFDDLDRNLESLRKGNVEYLVTRHIPMQSFRVLTVFAECVIKGKSPKLRNNYVHMDILHRRNLDDY